MQMSINLDYSDYDKPRMSLSLLQFFHKPVSAVVVMSMSYKSCIKLRFTIPNQKAEGLMEQLSNGIDSHVRDPTTTLI